MSKYTTKQFMKLYNKGDFEKAYHILQDIMKDCPDDSIKYAYRAELEMRVKNNLSKAEYYLNEAYSFGCPKEFYHQVSGNLFFRKGQFEKALEHYEKSYTISPSASNSLNFAMALSHTGDDRAITIWKDILRKNPKTFLAYVYIARDLGKREHLSEALEMLQKAKRLKPANANDLVEIGHAYHSLGQYQEAIEYYSKAEDYNYEDKANLYTGFANCYFELQDYTKALEHSYEAVKLKPQDSLANELLNRCKDCLLWLCGEHRNSEAYPMMEIALKIWSDDSRLLAYMASLEMVFKNNYELGKSYMNKAFEYSNTELDLLYLIKGALWFDCLKDKEEGLACLEKAVSLNRSDFNLVALASRIIDIDSKRAEKLFEEILRSDPKNSDAVYGLSDIALRNEDWQKGFELTRRAYELKPSNPSINVLLAYANQKLEKLNEALRFYLKAEELGFSDKAYLYSSMAECYQGLDKSNEARVYVRKALDIAPDNPEAKKLLDQLDVHEQ